MRYIDSGYRSGEQALGSWLENQLTPEVNELRWQTGFFSVDGLSPFAATLERLSSEDLPVRVLIGSNEGNTVTGHVAQLAGLMRLPRTEAKLGIVYYSGSYFHPKTYHLRRDDGTQAAYVGSANLTFPGLSALHVEAGLLLDTRDGDPESVLNDIAASVDDWFSEDRPGLVVVDSDADLPGLEAEGLLSAAPVARSPTATSSGTGGARRARPRLGALVGLPALPGGAVTTTSTAAAPPAATATPATAPPPPTTAVPRDPYPPYVLFDPGATNSTKGNTALSGSGLPGGNIGLIIRLNRDSDRHWRAPNGTANISVPLPTVSSLRFGIYRGTSKRPRAEFEIQMRFMFDGGDHRSSIAQTNVMVYGFEAGERGHENVRLVVPAPPAREIRDYVQANGKPMPREGDVALLEWPTLSEPAFKLSVLERGSILYDSAEGILSAAEAAGRRVGRGACWLQPGIFPGW